MIFTSIICYSICFIKRIIGGDIFACLYTGSRVLEIAILSKWQSIYLGTSVITLSCFSFYLSGRINGDKKFMDTYMYISTVHIRKAIYPIESM